MLRDTFLVVLSFFLYQFWGAALLLHKQASLLIKKLILELEDSHVVRLGKGP